MLHSTKGAATRRRSRKTFRAWYLTRYSGILSKLWQTPPARAYSSVRHAALIFLYRLLFVLYAEDRGLLPVNDSRYDDYGLRKRVRDDTARRIQDATIPSPP